MNKRHLHKSPRFLTHHFQLRPDCRASLTLPENLTSQEADRLSQLLNALVTTAAGGKADAWPYSVGGEDLDGDLDANAIDACDDGDPFGDLDGEVDEYGLPVKVI